MMAELIDKSSTLILQNLRLAEKDLLCDPSRILASRDYISRSSCLQICFYLSLALKSFWRQPSILLFGAGHIGSKLIEHLLECRLGHCLRIFARDDSVAKYWKARNIQSSSTLAELLRGSTADIVIICSGVSSFASISQSLLPYISKATFIISSCFGLSRKRLFNFLRASSIFRTFQEPQLARMKSEELLNSYNILITSNSDVASTQDLPKRNFTKRLSEQSADLLVRRCPEVRNMILLLENYYSLRGLNHSSARRQSVASLLGKRNDSVVGEDDGDMCPTHMLLHSCIDPCTLKFNDDIAVKEIDERVSRQRDTDSTLEGLADTSDYYRSILPPSVSIDEGSNECKSLSSRLRKSSKDPHGIHGIHAAQILLQDNVSVHFQRHLSKFILEADIPHSRDLRNDLEQPQRQHCTQIGDLGPSGNSVYSAESKAQGMAPDSTSTNGSEKEIDSNTSCNLFPIVLPMGSPQLMTNVVYSNAVGRRSLDSFSSTVPPKSRYDVNKMDLDAIRLETKAKILEDLDDAPKLREPLGTAMHSDQDVLRIFAEDSVFHGQRTFAACESVHGNEEEEAVPPDRSSTASCAVNDSWKSNCKDINTSLLVLLAELDDIHDFK